MEIEIITDSASDILQKEAKKLNIHILPLKTIFSDREYLDGVDLSHEDFFKKLIETREFPKTSQISPFDYEEEFKKHEGKEIIVITLSRKCSGCYQSAKIAAEDNPHIHIIDSENLSIGEQILVFEAIKLRDKGLSVDEIVSRLEVIKKDICVVALLDTLEYLKKGGRINAAQAIVGTMLSIKPVVGVKDGKIVMLGKARGSKNGHNMLRKLMADAGGVDWSMPYLAAYTGLSDHLVKKYIDDSKDLYTIPVEDIPIRTIGSTIGTHVGPGCIGVAFYKNKKNS